MKKMILAATCALVFGLTGCELTATDEDSYNYQCSRGYNGAALDVTIDYPGIHMSVTGRVNLEYDSYDLTTISTFDTQAEADLACDDAKAQVFNPDNYYSYVADGDVVCSGLKVTMYEYLPLGQNLHMYYYEMYDDMCIDLEAARK